jgi:hypothetical protein
MQPSLFTGLAAENVRKNSVGSFSKTNPLLGGVNEGVKPRILVKTNPHSVGG